MKNKQLVNIHMKNYVEAVFADRLREEGFISVKDRHFCWYRIQSNDIINAVYFLTRWNAFPVIVDISYGIHPLFAMPHYQASAHTPDQEGDTVISKFCRHNCFRTSMAPFSEDINVLAPIRGKRGLEALEDQILPEMRDIKTLEDCYYAYKKQIQNTPFENLYQSAYERDEGRTITESEWTAGVCFTYYSTPTFIDEAIYLNDEEMFPLCAKYLERRLKNEMIGTQKDPSDLIADPEVNRWSKQRAALMNPDARREHIAMLDQQKIANIAALKKKFHIPFEIEQK